MRIQCNTFELSEVCSTVQRSVAQKSTLPSIEGIYMEAKESRLYLSGYDLEMGVSTAIECKTEKEGCIVLNARLLCDILRKLPGERLVIDIDEHNICRITSGSTEFSLIGIPADDYPEMPSVSGGYTFSINHEILKNMIRQTIFAVSTLDSKLVHKGVKFEIADNAVKLVAVDGFRLAIRLEKTEYTGEPLSFVVPSKTLNEVMKLSPEDSENVTMSVGKRIISFEIGKYVLVSRLLEGEFLKYQSTIPDSCTTKVRVSLKQFSDAIDRASLIITNKLKSPVKCVFDEGSVAVSSTTALGASSDRIAAVIEGKRIEIGFNNTYLLDALRVCDSDEIIIELNSPVSPIIIKPVAGDSFLFLVLPVRLKSE